MMMGRRQPVIEDHTMKFLSFEKDGYASFGAVTDGGIVDLGAKHGGLRDLRDAIRADRLGELIAEANDTDADYALADVDLLPTIPNPEKIICIGVNYANRNEEYKDGSAPPKYPSVFMRTRESLVGHEQDILRLTHTNTLPA
jgi:5-carboxymethyl-2-hydroxymuconate isomerase